MVSLSSVRQYLPSPRVVLVLLDLAVLITVVVALYLDWFTEVDVPRSVWAATFIGGVAAIVGKAILSLF